MSLAPSSASTTPAALVRWLPRLERALPWAPLGDWPTPIDEVRVAGRPLWIKREGASSARYGGNKVRTLEAWLGHARHAGARRIWAIGAYGSNHVIATVLHARALGLDAGAILFPQPYSEWAAENAGAMIAAGCPIVRLPSVALVPLAAATVAARERSSIVMPPGGATPIGTFGALSAVFELADQVADGILPAPGTIVLPIGSTCTTAGLLAGLSLARATGAWRWPLPTVYAVRVTPWPVTSRVLVTQLAAATLARVASLGGPDVTLGTPRLAILDGTRDPQAPRLVLDRRELGRGYGRMTPRCRDALATCASGWPRLDGVYTGKAAAALLRLHAAGARGPLLFWATKSETMLAGPTAAALHTAPPALVRWLAGA